MTEPTPGLRQTLTWKGGFWLALVIPMSGLTLVGYEIGALGAWGALAVWLGTSVIALLLLVFNLFMIVIGFTHPALIGYGGGTEQLIALSVIVVGLVSYFFTRRVQLGLRGRRLWQDDPESPARPSETETVTEVSAA